AGNALNLCVSPDGPNDPILAQMSSLLSTCIHEVRITSADDFLTPDDLTLWGKMLSSSKISSLTVRDVHLDDVTAPLILSIASHSSRLILYLGDMGQVSDPNSFITKLSSIDIEYVSLIDETYSNSFFGLGHSFWVQFLYEKLSNGSFESIEPGNMRGKITRAPFDLPDTRISSLNWHKKN
ncbi:hypothetical protein PMAYCL1PPCAC_27460, partial [Pristionchus mayeri]